MQYSITLNEITYTIDANKIVADTDNLHKKQEADANAKAFSDELSHHTNINFIQNANSWTIKSADDETIIELSAIGGLKTVILYNVTNLPNHFCCSTFIGTLKIPKAQYIGCGAMKQGCKLLVADELKNIGSGSLIYYDHYVKGIVPNIYAPQLNTIGDKVFDNLPHLRQYYTTRCL